jgi:hypothetical protein
MEPAMSKSPTPSDRPESWRPVPGYEGLYLVSDKGRVQSLPRRTATNGTRGGKMLKPALRGHSGYERHYVILCKGSRSTNWPVAVHQLVMLAFEGPCPQGQEVRHLDGNPFGNWYPENLAYGTHKENGADMARHGFAKAGASRGEGHFRAKLTEELVIQIRKEYAAGGVTERDLASRHGVNVSTLHRLLVRKTWTHV